MFSQPSIEPSPLFPGRQVSDFRRDGTMEVGNHLFEYWYGSFILSWRVETLLSISGVRSEYS